MKRSFPPPARGAFRALAGVVACGAAACAPNQGVKPGAPQLIELTLVQAGPTTTTIAPDTGDCVSGIKSGDACNLAPIEAADGGAATPADKLCRDGAATWCSCFPDPADDTQGAWSCEPFANVAAVIAVFDRLLDTAPLDPGDAAGLTDVVTTSASGGAPAFGLESDYSSTGAADGFIFNLFGPAYFGNFRGNGPSLYAAPRPAFPSDATVTVSLDADKVRAKDGTPFTGDGLLRSGTVTFQTAPFAASVSPQPAPTPDDPDPSKAATVAFTNFVDPAVAAAHITATSNGTNVPITAESGDGGASFTVLPADGEWVSGATIVVTVDATTENLLGQTLAAAESASFTAR